MLLMILSTFLLLIEYSFAAVEKEYEEKVAANRVNWVDEILYRKAQVAEDARLKRLELDKPDPKEIVPR